MRLDTDRMRVWRARRWLGGALVALAVAAAVALASSSTAEAQPQQLGAFVGAAPLTGGIGLLVTTEDASPEALEATLGQAGCEVTTVTMQLGGTLAVHVPGAPPLVNAGFPATIAAETPLVVRCRAAIVPTVDPPNASYVIGSDVVALADGSLEVPAAPGSATKIVTTLAPRRTYGDLDGDGAVDAAVALVQHPGGSGTFHYLAVVGGASSGPAPTVLLGDRVIVDRVAIAHGRVTVSYLARDFDEPLAAVPTVPVSRSFVLEGVALVEVGSGVCEAPDLDEISSFVFVTTPSSGSEVLGRFDVTGCSRTFESTVNWRLLDRAGTELASGFAMGGGVDGAGRFAFTVEYDTASVVDRQIGHLEVFEVDASGGEGFPPPSNTIVLVLN